jgi:hypothetical protein
MRAGAHLIDAAAALGKSGDRRVLHDFDAAVAQALGQLFDERCRHRVGFGLVQDRAAHDRTQRRLTFARLIGAQHAAGVALLGEQVALGTRVIDAVIALQAAHQAAVRIFAVQFLILDQDARCLHGLAVELRESEHAALHRLRRAMAVEFPQPAHERQAQARFYVKRGIRTQHPLE